MLQTFVSIIKTTARFLIFFYSITKPGIFVAIGTTIPYWIMLANGNSNQIIQDFSSIDKTDFLIPYLIFLVFNSIYKIFPQKYHDESLAKSLNILSTLLIGGFSLFIVACFAHFGALIHTISIAVSCFGSPEYGYTKPLIGIAEHFVFFFLIILYIFSSAISCTVIIGISEYTPSIHILNDLQNQYNSIKLKYKRIVICK
jgi:hypothetical protein